MPGGNAHRPIRVKEGRLIGFLSQRQALNAGQFRHPVDEEEAGQDHAQFDGNRQVENDRDKKGGQQDDPVIVGIAAQFDEVMPFAHVDRHHHDDGRQRRERYIRSERRGDQHNAEQHQRVDDAGNRRPATGFDIGGGAGNGTGGRKATEERCRDIREPLGDQFLVGIVAVIDLAIGHTG